MLCEYRRMQSEEPRYWEDHEVGRKYPLGSTSFTAEEIVEFAEKFDPQSFHVDAEAAKSSLFGGLCASGWHVADKRTALGSPGLDELRWLKPARPGDTLTAWVECADKVPSKSRPTMGVIHEHWTAVNQNGELVMTAKGINMVRRRPG